MKGNECTPAFFPCDSSFPLIVGGSAVSRLTPPSLTICTKWFTLMKERLVDGSLSFHKCCLQCKPSREGFFFIFYRGFVESDLNYWEWKDGMYVRWSPVSCHFYPSSLSCILYSSALWHHLFLVQFLCPVNTIVLLILMSVTWSFCLGKPFASSSWT